MKDISFFMKNIKKLGISFCILFLLFIGCTLGVSSNSDLPNSLDGDIDPLVDISITVTITGIRPLETNKDSFNADFFVKIYINNQEYTSPIWYNTKYVNNPNWSATLNVPDDQEFVNVKIELWDWNPKGSTLCDINDGNQLNKDRYDIELLHSIKTGRWTGDDYIGDTSGYGRVSGDFKKKTLAQDHTCELWFTISQNDYDNDGLPYWVETNVYGTNPTVDNRGEDIDNDGIPIEWEHQWNYNPLIWDDHQNIDPDQDSLTNIEEYRTRDMNSDPYRKDVFLELDFMQESPDGISSIVPDEAYELLKNPFHRRNIVFHISTTDYDGGEKIPFDDQVTFEDAIQIYNTYFLHNDTSNWKRSVFHYGIIVYQCTPKGYGFSADDPPHIDYFPGTHAFIMSSKQMEKNARQSLTKSLAYFYGSAMMHEMGHNFGLRLGHPFGCDAQLSKKPWQLGYWYYQDYKSIMNYRYTYKIFDYSDGTHGQRDFNDWAALDFSHFEKTT